MKSKSGSCKVIKILSTNFSRMLKSIYKNACFVSCDKYYAHISHIFIKIKGDIYDVYGKRNISKYEKLENKGRILQQEDTTLFPILAKSTRFGKMKLTNKIKHFMKTGIYGVR